MSTPHLNRLLHKAAKAGDAKKIVRLVRRGACPSSKGRDGRSIVTVIEAINDEKLRSACKVAIRIGVAFRAVSRHKMFYGNDVREANLERLLRNAVKTGDAKKVRSLVRRGAVGDVNGRDGRNAFDLVNDIEDSETRVRCCWAMLSRDLDEYFEDYPERRDT